MANIRNISAFNDNRRDINKIKTLNDEIVLFTKDEARDTLTKYIVEELDLFSAQLSKEYKDNIEKRISYTITQVEEEIMVFLNNKIDKITEKIVEASINRIVEAEVNKRVEIKLKQIKIKHENRKKI
jgi:hypothetical protein